MSFILAIIARKGSGMVQIRVRCGDRGRRQRREIRTGRSPRFIGAIRTIAKVIVDLVRVEDYIWIKYTTEQFRMLVVFCICYSVSTVQSSGRVPRCSHSGATPRGRVVSEEAITEYVEAARANATNFLDRIICVGSLADRRMENSWRICLKFMLGFSGRHI